MTRVSSVIAAPEHRPPGYNEYISSSCVWQEKRQLRLNIDRHMCQTCHHDGSEYRLEIHHKTYERFGCEDVELDLITLCSECHEAITTVIRRRRYKKKDLGCNFIVAVTQTRKEIVR